MNPATRGAAKVSIMWMISVGVIALLAFVFAFVSNGDVAAARDAKAVAEADEAVARENLTEANDIRRDISAATGWTNGGADSRTDLAAMESSKQLLRDNFELTVEDKTFEDMIPKLVSEVNKLRKATKTAEGVAEEERAATGQVRGTLSQITADKDSTIAEQKSALADQKSGFEDREGDLSDQVATANDQIRELEEQVARLKADGRRVVRSLKGEISDMNAKNAYLSDLTQPLTAPANLVPDGKILTVSKDLPLAWIDLGANDRLVLGTRFRVEGGNLGERHLKGWVEVMKVEAKMAEVRYYDVVDVFDPIVTGDFLVNPIYDPESGYNAIFVGRFSGIYGKEQLSQLLDKIGIRVQDKLDLTTNFLIVGAPILQDEDGYPLEDAIEPSDLPVYQEAVANHVQIIPLSSIQEFFRF